MKEVKVKLTEEIYKKLKEMSERELRPITKQVTLYILRGLRDKNHQESEEQEAVRE